MDSLSSDPIRGMGSYGKASCHRMSIMRQNPKNRNSRLVIAYWIPITL